MRDELRSLPRPTADRVASHLVAAGRLLDDDPPGALSQALAARRLASRVGVVREAVGVAAYHAGEWHTAITELRTYQRMSGRPTHLALVADCERALGRPERAIDLYRSAPRDRLTTEEAVELLIVAAGARADLGQVAAAVAMLQVPELVAEGPWAPRLRYAYADALRASGRTEEAREWFARAAEADEYAATDAADRLLELDGVVMADIPPADNGSETRESEAPDGDPGEDPEGDRDGGVAGGDPDGDLTGGHLHVARPAAPPAVAGPDRLVDGYDLVVLDLDGVLYVGDQPVPGAVETIVRLRDEGVPMVFATNNASRDPGAVAELLTRIGVPASAGEVLTSAMVAADELAARLPAGSAVLVVGAEALAAEVRRVGLRPVRHARETPAAVVQGYAPDVGWQELAEACVAIRAGASWVATNADPTLPSPRGPLPGNGALVAALREALGRGPELVAGKPDPEFFRIAARRAGSHRTLVVGDRLETDIHGARRAGFDSLLVLTGIATEAQVRAAVPDGVRPTYLAPDLTGLLMPPRSGPR